VAGKVSRKGQCREQAAVFGAACAGLFIQIVSMEHILGRAGMKRLNQPVRNYIAVTGFVTL
jgi:hypothetical protein